MDTESLHCPNCGAALPLEGQERVVVCSYCQSTVRIAVEGASGAVLATAVAPEPELPEEVEAEILQLLREGQRIQAIRLYLQHKEVSLKEAKDAVDAMGKRIGMTFSDASGSLWPCVGIVVGFLLWMALIALTPAAVERGLLLLFEKSLPPGRVETIQVLTTLFLVVLSIAVFIVWLNVRNRKQRRRTGR